jgi:hypothetical protein
MIPDNYLFHVYLKKIAGIDDAYKSGELSKLLNIEAKDDI